MGLHIRKDKRKEVKRPAAEVFGIVGSGRGVGVTHFSIQLANYLTGVLGKRTAVLEWNDSGDFERIEKFFCKKSVLKRVLSAFKLLEVFYVKRAGQEELLECINQGFDSVVIDFGNDYYSVREEFLRCGRKVLLGSLCEWQAEAFIDLLVQEKNWEGRWTILTVFGSEEAAAELKKRMHISVGRIPESMDAFAVTGETMAFFDEFLKY